MNAKMLRLLLIACLFIFVGIFSQSQADNLLTNPGFELEFVNMSGDQPRDVALGWLPWHVARTADMPSFQNVQPKYEPVAPNSARVRSGNNAQQYFSFFETHEGGIYQRVTGVTEGTELRFSIYGYVWSSTFEDVNISEDPGDVSLSVGIDPTGGTDGTSGNIVWSTPAVFYDTYRQYSVIATAQGDTVTVFVRSTVGLPVQSSYVYLDDAELASTGEPAQPTDAPTDVPPTDEPTDEPPTEVPTTPPPTDEPATDVPTIAATEEPTDAPDEPTATATSVPPTDVPTNTPDTVVDPNEEPTPTREVDSDLPTNTPAVTNVPTATDVAVGGNDPDTAVTPISEDFPGTIFHTVRRGDTVGDIARLYNSTTGVIIEANGLDDSALIFIDQRLAIPVRIPDPATVTPTDVPTVAPNTPAPTQAPTGDTGDGSTYVVQPGDTLSAIARRFNTTLSALVQLNGIANPNQIFVGQRLNIPPTGGADAPVPTSPPADNGGSDSGGDSGIIPTPAPPVPNRYVVQPGDNLFRISLRFNVSLVALAQANNITNYNRIFIGQTLTIPS